MAKVSKDEAIREASESRNKVLMNFAEDPYIGYETLEAASAEYQLNSQAEVLARMLNGENIFVSGPAGSGKSTVVNKFIDILDADTSGKANIAVTASTGIAASLIGGQTIHSWSGIGIETKRFNRQSIPPMAWARRESIMSADVLIIDEVSMLPAYLFINLDKLLKHFRKSSKPFGGIQLILLGDFLQLPPVSKGGHRGESDAEKEARLAKWPDERFCVFTEEWKAADISHCYMDKTHRATDKKLKYVLNRVSRGKAEDDLMLQVIKSRVGKEEMCDPNKTYTRLYTTNKNVDEFNEAEFELNLNPAKTFHASTEGKEASVKKVFKTNGIQEKLRLKIGAKVMLTSNTRFEDGTMMPNGSLGVVQTFLGGSPRVKFNNGEVYTIIKKVYTHKVKKTLKTKGADVNYEEVEAAVSQLPLKLGYAITVHKSQGQTFDGVVADLSKCFTPGLGYVALSRVRSMDDLVILDINEKAYRLDNISRKASNAVKIRAGRTREHFMKEITHYDAILTSDMYRNSMVRNEIIERMDLGIS